jgi:Predicted membrane protein
MLPGLGLCAVAVALSLGVASWLPGVSALLAAIVLGVLLRNTVRLPAAIEPGLAFAAKKLLRLGVVFLGLQLVLGDILGLGAGMILVVVAIVVIGIGATMLIGRWMGVSLTQRLLIACGFSICGAAAIAAVDGVIETEDEEEVVTGVALVVVFGTLMIPIIPLLATAMHLTNHEAGVWAGGSVHEVAQVVATGGAIGGAALGLAVIVKLARVLMLAPVMAVISIVRRRALRRAPLQRDRGAAGTDGEAPAIKLPPIVPLFVLGFIAMVLLRSTGWLPTPVLDIGKVAQTALLAAAMFALGMGVHVKRIVKVGPKPFLLALASTAVVASTALAGVLIVS